MSKDKIKFYINGNEVEASSDETIWEVSKRENINIPHLCHADEPGYRSVSYTHLTLPTKRIV